MNIYLFIYIALAIVTFLSYVIVNAVQERELTTGMLATGILTGILSPFYVTLLIVGFAADTLEDSKVIFRW